MPEDSKATTALDQKVLADLQLTDEVLGNDYAADGVTVVGTCRIPIGDLLRRGIIPLDAPLATVNSANTVSAAGPIFGQTNDGQLVIKWSQAAGTDGWTTPFATTSQGARADTALQPADVVDDLVTGGSSVPGSAEQLKVLKGFIDSINALLVSDEVSLDELQEIVDYIQQNRADLDALGIANIAGLQSALDAKLGATAQAADVDPAGASIAGALAVRDARLDNLEQVEFPDPTNSEFQTQIKDGVLARLKRSPLERPTTYYISSSSGDDSNDGSEESPWETLAKVQAIIDESGFTGDVRFRFKAGDEWRELTFLDDGGHPVTFDSYGRGDRPYFNYFTKQYPAGSLWTSVSGNQYSLSESTDIAILRTRDKADRLTPLIEAADEADCLATDDSFFYDATGDELFVNLGGDDPNAIDLEAAPDQDSGSNGDRSAVTIRADGSRIDGLESHGAGVSIGNRVTQNEAFKSKASGSAYNAITNCVGYYGSTHVMAHWVESGSGGYVTFQNCRAGLTREMGGSGTVFNAYARDGENSVWFVNCVVDKTSRPSPGDVNQPTVAFKSHTAASALHRDIVLFQCCAEGMNLVALSDLPSADSLLDVRGLIVSCHAKGTPDFEGLPALSGLAYINCIFEQTPPNKTPYALSSQRFKGWVINSLWLVDLTNYTSQRFALQNASGISNGRFIHSGLILTNVQGTGFGGGVRLEYSNEWDASGQDVLFANSVIDPRGAGSFYTSTTGNGYIGLDTNWYSSMIGSGSLGYQADDNPVTGGTAVDEGAVIAHHLFGAAAPELKGAGTPGFAVPYDIFWQPRNMATPTIGPVEY